MKKVLFYYAAIVFLFVFSACSNENSKKEITFSTENNESIPASTPKRIISLAPSITEILFALNLNDKIVGVTDFCNYPKEAESKKRIGGFINPNIETILALSPDLVVATYDGNDKKSIEKIISLNITVKLVRTASVKDIYTSIENISKWTNKAEQGQLLINKLKNDIKKITENIKEVSKPGVLMVFGHKPLSVAGPNTFSDELIKLAGGINIAGDALIRYPTYSLEEVVKKDPDFIIEAAMIKEDAENEIERFNNEWNKLPHLKAVKQKHIYVLDPDIITRPGPRVSIALRKLVEIIHPENK